MQEVAEPIHVGLGLTAPEFQCLKHGQTCQLQALKGPDRQSIDSYKHFELATYWLRFHKTPSSGVGPEVLCSETDRLVPYFGTQKISIDGAGHAVEDREEAFL
jgi:hypothetical protein